jgi:hypothetical protein
MPRLRKVRGRTARSSAKISISAPRPRIYAADPACQKCPPAGRTISYGYRTGVNREGRYRGATAARTTDAAADRARPVLVSIWRQQSGQRDDVLHAPDGSRLAAPVRFTRSTTAGDRMS